MEASTEACMKASMEAISFRGSRGSFHGSNESFRGSRGGFHGSDGSFHGRFHELPPKTQIVQVARAAIQMTALDTVFK